MTILRYIQMAARFTLCLGWCWVSVTGINALWARVQGAQLPCAGQGRQPLPSRGASTSRRKRHLYWAMAAALDLHREAALPVPELEKMAFTIPSIMTADLTLKTASI